MALFSDISIKICDLKPQVPLHSMFMALKVGQFSDNLCRDPSTTIDELRMRVTDYIQMEEMVEFHNNVCVGQSLATCNTKEHRVNTFPKGNESRDGTQPLVVLEHLGENRCPDMKAP
ncbi:hypothetical protein CR513_56239, partial [Mucuna pruriens]